MSSLNGSGAQIPWPSAFQVCYVHIFVCKSSELFQQSKVLLSFSKCFLLSKNCQVLHDRSFQEQSSLSRTSKILLEGGNNGLVFQIVRVLDD